MINPVRWVTHQATTGLKELPRNSAWLLSKALRVRTTADGIRKMTAVLPGGHDTVEGRLKRAEAAVARAQQAEEDALAQAQRVKQLADAAAALAEEGKERIRQAKREAEEEIDRRTESARERFAQVVDAEHDKARREAAKAVDRVAADVRASADKAVKVAQAAAAAVRDQIDRAHREMESARSLAEEAAAVAERVAAEAHEYARTLSHGDHRSAESADLAVGNAQRTQQDLTDDAALEVHPDLSSQLPVKPSDTGPKIA